MQVFLTGRGGGRIQAGRVGEWGLTAVVAIELYMTALLIARPKLNCLLSWT